jgi:hypothetical protein
VEEKEFVICASMGPGVCLELVLLRTLGWDSKRGTLERMPTKLLLPASEDSESDTEDH